MHNTLATQHRLSWYLLLVLALGLGGCGFQPRGQAPALPASLSPLAITGVDTDQPLYLALQRRLKNNGNQLAADPGQARAVLVISNLTSRNELISVDRTNKAIEYELIEALTYQVRAGSRESAPQRLQASRLHYTPGTALLARNREEAELRQRLHEELADRLLRRLAAWQ